MVWVRGHWRNDAGQLVWIKAHDDGRIKNPLKLTPAQLLLNTESAVSFAITALKAAPSGSLTEASASTRSTIARELEGTTEGLAPHTKDPRVKRLHEVSDKLGRLVDFADRVDAGQSHVAESQLLSQIHQLREWSKNGALTTTFTAGGVSLDATFNRLEDKVTAQLASAREKNLGFDLDKASRAVRSDFVRKNGGQFVSAMPKDDQNAWIRAFLVKDVAPISFSATAATVEGKAQQAHAASQAKAAANRAAKSNLAVAAGVQPPAPQPGAAPPAPGLSAPDPVIHSSSMALTFSVAPTQRTLAGWSTKYIVHDQHGNEWLFKPEEKIRAGLPGEYRTDMEHAAHQIANHVGFQTAESRLVTINGTRGQVQRMFPDVEGDLTGADVTQLSARQQQDIVDEHVLDWLLANHDGHEENLLRLKDGSLVGIDKGAGFKFYGKDKLAIGFRPGPQQTKPHPHDAIYKAIIAGDIDQATADDLVRSQLARAARIELATDDPIRSALLEAQKNRPTSTFRDSTARNPAELANLVVARKKRLSKDFEKFWRDIYKQAGYTFDDDLVPDRKEMAQGRVDGVHSGLSKQLFEEVAVSKQHGVPAFFAGTDLEDGHILLWQETWDNKPVTRGLTTLREEADKRITTWLNMHKGRKLTSGNGAPQTPQEHDDIHLAKDMWPSVEDVARNYSAHTTDGNYSARRIQQAAMLRMTLQTELDHAKGRVVFKDKAAAGAQISWMQALNSAPAGSTVEVRIPRARSFRPLVKEDRGAGNSAVWVDKSTGTEYASYITLGKMDGQNLTHPGTLTPAAVGGDLDLFKEMASYYIDILDTLDQHRINQTKPGRVSKFTFKPQAPAPTNPAASSPPTLQLKVSEVPSARHPGTFDHDTGELKATGTLPSNTWATQKMFRVEVDSDVEIDYRPWAASSYATGANPLSQQGQLYLTMKNFDGEPKSFEKIIRALDEMGVDLKPAERDDLELLYWRQMYGLVQNRQDSKAEYVQTRREIATGLQNTGMSADQEIQVYKRAFAKVWGDDVVDNADYRPQMSHGRIQNADLHTGRPFWYRPDLTKQKIKSALKSKFPFHGVANVHSMLDIVKSGSLVSAEERIRFQGQIGANSHASSDQTSGGANYVFTALGRTPGQTTHFTSTGAAFILSPDVARRTSAWHLDMMQSGAITARTHSAKMDPATWGHGMHNALHVKNGVSVLDDVEGVIFNDSSARNQAVAFYKKNGIDTIRGLPIEDRFVVKGTPEVTRLEAKAWEAYLRDGTLSSTSGTSTVRPRRSTSATAPGQFSQKQDVIDYVNQNSSLNTVHRDKAAKYLWDKTKRLIGMNGAFPGPRADKWFNHGKNQPFRFTDKLVVHPRDKFQVIFPAKPRDVMDLQVIKGFLDHPALLDPSLINSTMKPTVAVVNGKKYLTGGYEAFYAARLLGKSIEVDYTRYDYMTDAQLVQAGLK